MNENRFSNAEWQTLDDEIQKRLRALADEVQAAAPSVEPRFRKTVTERFPLFSYVSFRRPQVSDGEYIIVGADIAPVDGQWRIDADISDEEEGTIYFELPRTPFSVATFEELKGRVLHTVEQLIKEGRPTLLRLFCSSVAVLSSPAAALPNVARKG